MPDFARPAASRVFHWDVSHERGQLLGGFLPLGLGANSVKFWGGGDGAIPDRGGGSEKEKKDAQKLRRCTCMYYASRFDYTFNSQNTFSCNKCVCNRPRLKK